MQHVFWELRYPNGKSELEPSENASIMTAPLGAHELRLLTQDYQLIMRVALEGKRPVFYRVRSMGFNTDPQETRVDAIVFGKGWEEGSRIETDLFAVIDGHIKACPEHLGDLAMIELQVTRQ